MWLFLCFAKNKFTLWHPAFHKAKLLPIKRSWAWSPKWSFEMITPLLNAEMINSHRRKTTSLSACSLQPVPDTSLCTNSKREAVSHFLDKLNVNLLLSSTSQWFYCLKCGIKMERSAYSGKHLSGFQPIWRITDSFEQTDSGSLRKGNQQRFHKGNLIPHSLRI